MSISGALSNAMSGLRAAGRASEIVSSNISNALTPGYGVRSLSLSSSTIGSGGVTINGVNRHANAALTTDLRLAGAEYGDFRTRAGFLNTVENLLGTPDKPDAISSFLSGFESTLITAASRPEAVDRLGQSVNAARDLTSAIERASQGIQGARTAADQQINVQVDRLNSALSEVKKLNTQITRSMGQGNASAALLDQRQLLVDEISSIVPLREVARDNGTIALYTSGGAILLDGAAAEISFDPANLVTAYMSQSAGSLSGLEINGIAIRTDSEYGALRGGTLGANFAIRDKLGVEAQAKLDAIARDLVERFQDPSVDPTLLAGDAGLFTDNGAAFAAADEIGLSQRLQLNAAVDPDQGGETWRLRDGIGAATPGEVGDSTILQSLSDTLNQTRVPASGGLGSGAFSAINLLATFTSQLGTDRHSADQSLSFAAARFNELTQLQLADGVDTDNELQRLLVIEQTYAANARMIQAADEMMQTIMRL